MVLSFGAEMVDVCTSMLLWAELIFIWAFAAYGLEKDPIAGSRGETPTRWWHRRLVARAFVAAMGAFMLAHSIVIAFSIGIAVWFQAEFRAKVPGWSLLLDLVFPFAMAFMISRLVHMLDLWSIQFCDTTIASDHLFALLVVATLLLCVARGAGYVIRGILDKAQPKDVDQTELRHGFLIGIAERLLLTLVVALGSFVALGFLVAVKSWVRSRQFEGDGAREFTEYFLLGTLLSVLFAVVAGLATHYIITMYWPGILTYHIQE